MLFQLNSRFPLLEMLDSHYKKKCRGVIVVMTINFSECGFFFISSQHRQNISTVYLIYSPIPLLKKFPKIFLALVLTSSLNYPKKKMFPTCGLVEVTLDVERSMTDPPGDVGGPPFCICCT